MREDFEPESITLVVAAFLSGDRNVLSTMCMCKHKPQLHPQAILYAAAACFVPLTCPAGHC